MSHDIDPVRLPHIPKGASSSSFVDSNKTKIRNVQKNDVFRIKWRREKALSVNSNRDLLCQHQRKKEDEPLTQTMATFGLLHEAIYYCIPMLSWKCNSLFETPHRIWASPTRCDAAVHHWWCNNENMKGVQHFVDLLNLLIVQENTKEERRRKQSETLNDSMNTSTNFDLISF